MARTVRRNVLSVNINNLNEKYDNFVEFHGLCTNKNYVGIDQRTFSEVENMYVDQNNELSTRPTVKQILVFDSKYVILDIVKINERVFYHVQDTEDDKYYVLFEYTFEGSKNLKTLEASEKVHVCWFNSGYAVFTENNIYSIRFDKDDYPLVFQGSGAVYAPITKIVSGTETVENESPNLFTSSYVTRYLFEYGKDTIHSDIVGEKVDVTIGDTTYHDIVFQEYNDKVFYKRFGTITDVDVIISRQNSAGTNIFVAYKYDTLEYYISINGAIFLKDNFPELATANQIPVLSDDANTVYIIGDVTYDEGELYYYVNLYSKSTITTTSDYVSQDWSSEQIWLRDKTYNYWYAKKIENSKYVMYTTVYRPNETIIDGKIYSPYYANPFGYSTGTGNVAYILPIRFDITGYITNNNDANTSGSIDIGRAGGNYFVTLIKSNDIINYDFVTTPLEKDYANKIRYLSEQRDKVPMIVFAKI